MSGPEPSELLDATLVGQLKREYLLPFNRPPRVNQLGGNLAYTASSLALWGGRAGLVARVNADYPLEWLGRLAGMGFDTSGVSTAESAFDDRFFVAYSDPLTAHFENPPTYFSERGLEFPRELLVYEPNTRRGCSKLDYLADSFRVTDMPRPFLEVSAAHICPMDFISHKILPSVIKAGMIQSLSMRSASCYMDPLFWEDMRGLLCDLTTFMTTETQALKLFQGRSVDLWEIAQILSGYGPEFVIIHRQDGSAWLYDRVRKKRWIIPAYPARLVDPTHMLDAFDGGFLLNYRKDYDPLEGALCGQISAAVASEGSGPYFLLDTLPVLLQARLDTLRQQVIMA